VVLFGARRLAFGATAEPPLDWDGDTDDGDGGRSREKKLPLKDGKRETALFEEDWSSLNRVDVWGDVGAVTTWSVSTL
jgi:hypothetical protein